ncbi:MAG: hypothetical protein QOE68_4462 [Thermoanaerobaculia bacterium]|jgi:hypothetical protein|nr:hypothetical protein [Thermoanaerobaculia bacterium]
MRARTPFLILFSLLFLASVAAADTIAFDPPGVTVKHSVDAIVSGLWNDGCVPSAKSVVVFGSAITLTLDANLPPDVVCLAAVTPYAALFHLGILPVGSYTVIAVSERAGVVTERARTALIVRDSETVLLWPYAVPVTGGRIGILNLGVVQGNTVTIDGVTAPVGGPTEGPPSFEAPPHAPGAVDVIVDLGSHTVTSKAALIYYDPASTDPATFETILFPVSFQGPGALGSQWVTENFISWSGATFRDPLPCCASVIAGNSPQLLNNANPWGIVLYAVRGTADSLHLASRIRDTSRQAETAGTEVPVVRERNFRSRLSFINVPVNSRYRVMLRLWAIGDDPFGNNPQFVASAPFNPPSPLLPPTPVPFLPISMARIPGTAMWFGSIDVTSLLTRTPANPKTLQVYPTAYRSEAVPLAFPRIWGMLSITNNDTHQVTIISPH